MLEAGIFGVIFLGNLVIDLTTQAAFCWIALNTVGWFGPVGNQNLFITALVLFGSSFWLTGLAMVIHTASDGRRGYVAYVLGVITTFCLAVAFLLSFEHELSGWGRTPGTVVKFWCIVRLFYSWWTMSSVMIRRLAERYPLRK